MMALRLRRMWLRVMEGVKRGIEETSFSGDCMVRAEISAPPMD